MRKKDVWVGTLKVGSSGVPLHSNVTTDNKYVLCISKGRKKDFVFLPLSQMNGIIKNFKHKRSMF